MITALSADCQQNVFINDETLNFLKRIVTYPKNGETVPNDIGLKFNVR